MRFTGYIVYSLLLLTATTWAEFRGFTLNRVNQLSNVPKTVRDNPGAWRAVYGDNQRYVGGK